MPCINRIRVNNVKYNFGTQQYDDFSMRMYGKNTLYDLANGGGKSVLMLLLLQNLIPNCTLDDKQPIEKLFRNGGGNTTIHSLIEWKLDDADIKDGYRYMTTGFCARKAKESDEGASQDGQTAAIEYFNYCIFYRDYNKNDIINLPLSNGNERITYSGLKSYIKELGHKDMSLEVRLFERKGEYQRFISEYGLHESHWEIIRGINKTEGHVRTYFETNYKTTRKVVEDLLIEEIIEKAFLTRTGRDGDESTMAETLLDIKDKLNVLAQKKRDIANFDHQIELINVLQAKVNSCINQYEAHEDITRQLADIYVTGKELTSRENEHLEELLVAKQTAFEQKESQKKRLENLKITRDGFRLQELRDKSEQLNANLAENERQVSALKQDMNMKESINDYLGYLEDKKQLSENQKIIDHILQNTGADREKMTVYAYNRKLRDDAHLKELLLAKEEVEQSHEHAVKEADYCTKCIKEGEIELAVSGDNRRAASDKLQSLNNKISELTSQVALLVVSDAANVIEASEEKAEELEASLRALAESIREDQEQVFEDRYRLSLAENSLETLEKEYETSHLDAEEYRQAAKKLESIMAVYSVEKAEEIIDAINARITGTLTETITRKQEIDRQLARRKYLESGRLFGPSAGASAVIDYIVTRHGHMAMHGADYLAALKPEQRTEILKKNRALPYGVVVKNFADIAEDINLDSIQTDNEMVLIYDMDDLSEKAVTLNENAVMVCRKGEYFTDDEILKSLKEELTIQIRGLEDEISMIDEKLATYREDLAFVGHLADERHLDAADIERKLNQDLLNKKDEVRELQDRIAERTSRITHQKEDEASVKEKLHELEEDKSILLRIKELSDLAVEEEVRYTENVQKEQRITGQIEELKRDAVRWNTTVSETEARMLAIANSIQDIQDKWQNYFKPYYPEDGKVDVSLDPKQKIQVALGQETEDVSRRDIEILTISDEVLETEFMAMYAVANKNAPDVEDKKKLVQALSQSMDRILHTIEKRGVKLSDLEAQTQLFATSEQQLQALSDELMRLELVSASMAEELKRDAVRWNTTVSETEARMLAIANSIQDIQDKWQNYFKPYYPEDGKVDVSLDPKQKIQVALGQETEDVSRRDIEILTISDEVLETEFMAMYAVANKNAPDVEDKKKLVQALSQSMDRILHTIEKRGVKLSDLEAQTQLFATSEQQLQALSDELMRLELVSASMAEELKNVSKASGRLEGNIEYAVASLKKTYGEDAYAEEQISLSEAEQAIAQGDQILAELEQSYKKTAEEYETCNKEQGYMIELYKDVKRIVDTNDINVENGKLLEAGKEELRQAFETSLLRYDRSRKNLEKTRNELMRFKGQTAEALSEMGVFEMAETIRRDVIIPENYYDAKALLESLLQIISYIDLEKERVEKGIEDMVAIKENFCSQCLQRCMDVKTELEKLPKLSKITVGEEVIRMVDLTIPYVKEEFLAQRMSDYIDDIVKGADAYEDERKRVRYIRDCLALKRLFGVMVTDMNAIKLKLYKRERIKEQSRYLRYEEAVGSTGQSQGIYIQFLVAIINYIAGMYSYGAEGEISTKTIFIDNPFGAAKDVYIWEPIFAMLAANHVQLIVPARGATPAITGKFDVNYVLGQQMVGNRQQTVVVDYTSKTSQEELEYQDITYQQATFDFI